MAPPESPTIDGKAYIHALAAYIRQHESSLADFFRRGPPPTAPSWTTILTLGVVSSDVPIPRKPPLILRFDPHHLYFLLLKFDEIGIPNVGALDCLIDGGPSRPMSINYAGTNISVPPMIDSDSRSTFSAVSSFSIGSGWWGSSAPPLDETADVKYLYSSCTKLPALRLGPFSFSFSPPSSLTPSLAPLAPVPILAKPVKDFQDCPPPDTAVPLYAFKNLQSLSMDELDPRAFLGWDALSMHLRSLEVKRSGIEDIGELICDAVVEDVERRKKGRGGVGEERRRRQGLSQASQDDHTTPPPSPSAAAPATPNNSAAYPIPPAASWSRLAHLSLAHNSLTFIPSPPLQHLSSLTSLDLSSNLLIAVPPALSALHSLRSLNLSDNMIDSLHGLAKALGAVAVLNLSQNRLENLSGLDRLLALERLDLSENRLRESLEVSRLASLPVLTEVWVEGNPFARKVEEGGEDGWRVKCFSYFASEGRAAEEGGVKIDGTGPGLAERRTLALIEEGSGRKRPASEGARKMEATVAAGEAKMVGRRVVTTPHTSRIARGKNSNGHLDSTAPPTPNDAHSPPPSIPTSPLGSPQKLQPSAAPKPRRRKPQRIVDLDGDRSAPPSSVGGDHSGTEATSGGLSDSEDTSSPRLEAVRSAATTRKSHLEGRLPSDVREESESSSVRRHTRYPTSPTASGPGVPLGRIVDGSSSVGSRPKGRQGLSGSTFDPPTDPENDPFTAPSRAGGGAAAETSADAFRKKIEALRSEVGENWLSVLGEREMANERSKSQSDESGTDGKSRSKAPPADVPAPTVVDPTGAAAEVPVVKVVKGKKKKGKKKVGVEVQGP